MLNKHNLQNKKLYQNQPMAMEPLHDCHEKEPYLLRLYIGGMSPNSKQAINNVRKICSENLQGRHNLEIIDIYQQPWLAKERQIIAAPTLVKEMPLPFRTFIGDMSQTQRILIGLGVVV